jgi:hypothetical protein
MIRALILAEVSVGDHLPTVFRNRVEHLDPQPF